MADVDINKFRASVVRDGSKPASPGFVVSEGQDPVDPSGSGQNHLPVTIAAAATGLSITESQVLGGAGTVGQYIRGDGSLADFPESSGGGSSISYYLNGSVSQGTIGGVAYKELNKVPILGAGTDFTINADGYIASFLTDAGDPNLLEIPGGNWNFETFFSANSGGGSPTFYVELYKYNGTTFTLLASNSTFPELIAFGTNVTAYFSTLAVPTTTLALTDRLAVRFYVTHSGRTITLHTEDNHLCQIITTFTTGLTALNGLTAQVQNFAVGTSGTDFAIASATATHTFNLPTASATNRGALSSADWTTFNGKQNALTNPVTGTGTTNYLPKFTGASTIGNSQVFDNGSVVSIGTNATLVETLNINSTYASQSLNSTSGNFAYIGLLNGATGGGFYFAVEGSTGGTFGTGSTAYAGVLSRLGAYNLQFATDNVVRATINSSGNLLVGTTTDNGARLQVSGRTQISGGSLDFSTLTDLGIVSALTTGRSGTYQSNSLASISTRGDASSIELIAGVSSGFYTGISATANNASTFAGVLRLLTAGSERMRITNGGNVLIGTTTDVGAKLYVNGAIRTEPIGSGAITGNWKFGNEVSGTITENTSISVEIDGIEYRINARQV
jgi:hypothetical protein